MLAKFGISSTLECNEDGVAALRLGITAPQLAAVSRDLSLRRADINGSSSTQRSHTVVDAFEGASDTVGAGCDVRDAQHVC